MRVTAQPANVRTARQVAVTLGRRAGMPEEILQDVRLGVGEACGLTVGLHQALAGEEPVELTFRDDDGFSVEVSGRVPLPEASGAAAAAVLTDATSVNGNVLPLSADAVLAILHEVASVVEVQTGPEGSRLRLSWLPG